MFTLLAMLSILQPQSCYAVPVPSGPVQVFLRAPGGPYEGSAYLVRIVDVPDAWHAFVRSTVDTECGPGGWGPVVAVAELQAGKAWIPAAAVPGVTGWFLETYDDEGRRLTVTTVKPMGTGQPCPAAYGLGDLDGDGEIGLLDYAAMQNSFGGP